MDSVRPARWYPVRPGRWIAEEAWPSPAITMRDIEMKPASDQPVVVASPQTCGLAGGEYFPFTFGPELPGDQRPDDAYSACFDLPELEEPADILGAPEVLLDLSADRAQANVAVRLCNLHPDGASQLISYGVLNLTHGKGHELPEAIAPGQRMAVRVRLDQCACRVPAGHRLRVAVSSAYWPAIWPSPETVTLKVFGARLTLPQRPLAAGDEVAFLEPEGAEPWATEEVRPKNSERRVVRDEKTGMVRLFIDDDFGAVRDLGHGLVTGSAVRETWTIHPDDPLAARCDTHWTQEIGRGEWQLRTDTFATITCDDREFHLSARIEAYEGEERVLEKHFEESVPRVHS